MSDLIERLRGPCPSIPAMRDAADEIERLRQWETCGREWLGKTDWVQERVNAGSWPISALGKHRADVMREEIERLTAALQYEQHRADRQGTHGDGCADLGPAHYECAIRERDDHARWRADLADKLHDRETTISAAWEALRSAGVHSEATIDDGIRLLRRQLAEAELDAQRYRWLRGDSCPEHSVRWTQWEVRCWRAPQWTADLRRGALDAAIDAAMGGSDA